MRQLHQRLGHGETSPGPDRPSTTRVPDSLTGRVALVTGASRGVGRGIARGLLRIGATVYASGRSIDRVDLDDRIVRVACDHTDDEAVARLFRRVETDRGRLDVLVNNAWGGYERMVEGGKFTWPEPFWEQPAWRWDAMMNAGVRAAFLASQRAARMMVAQRSGLIVNVSHWAAQKRIGNAIYGVAKAATDKLTADTAVELREHGVTVVSLYPGLVRTEAVLAAGFFDLSNSESPEFQGRAVAALAGDPRVERWTGQVLVTAALAEHYGFADVDGKSPRPLTLADV
ncbi:MAG: SDR family NAD(P)-dependent oxidoreductase [Acidobacteria bacterium]|nr:SDR family NAD(P)-dependent oxidoreductase [Acidobacteriota bacterium]